jgi:hypothetical protein
MCGDDFDELSAAGLPSKYVLYWLCTPCTEQERYLMASQESQESSQEDISQEEIS